MNLTSLQSNLPILLKHNLVPFLWGHQGIGKTQIVSQAAQSLGVGFVPLYLGTCADVGDIIGIPHIIDGATHHAKPSWFPTSGEGIVFLDEFNRMHPDIAQAMFSFVQLKRLYTHTLPPGWKIIAAGNPDTSDYVVNSFADAALLSRFIHLKVEPTTTEFVKYAKEKGAHTVAAFAQAYPEMTSVGKKADFDVKIEVDNRALLEKIAPLETETKISDADRFEIYAGAVGKEAALAFIKFKNSQVDRLDLDMILEDYDSVKHLVIADNTVEINLDKLAIPINQLMTREQELNEVQLENVVKFLLDIPMEAFDRAILQIKTLKLLDSKNHILNNEEVAARYDT